MSRFYGHRNFGTARDALAVAAQAVAAATAAVGQAAASGDVQAMAAASQQLAMAQAMAQELDQKVAAQTLMDQKAAADAAGQVPSQQQVQTVSLDQGYHPATVDYAGGEPSFIEKAGMWIWVVPAGLVAAALGYYFVKGRKHVGGYRRRSRRSRR